MRRRGRWMVGLVLAASLGWGQLSRLQAPRSVDGELEAVDVASRRIRVRTADRTLTLRVSASTHILLPHRPGALDDLARGQPVRAAVQGAGAEATAEWILVQPADRPGQERAR